MISIQEAEQLALQYWQYLERLAHKRFPADENLALEALDYAWAKIQKDRWRFVREHGDKSFTTYLTVSVQRSFTDYEKKLKIRKQTPKWLRERGTFWVEAWRLLCIKRLSRHEAYQTLLAHADILGKDESEIDWVISEVLRREKPLQPMQTQALPDESKDGDNMAVAERKTPEQIEEQSQMSVLLENIFMLLRALLSEGDEKEYGDIVMAWLEKLEGRLKLEHEDYLLLKMVHEDGLKVTEAGRRLNMNVNQVSAKYRRLLQRIKKAFEECGLDAEMRQLLESGS